MNICNIEVYGVIYKIKNTINNKVYIGKTTNGFEYRYLNRGMDLEKVYNHHKKRKELNIGHNKHLLSAFDKYGLNNFELTKVFDVAFSKEELNIKEKCWISIFNSFKNGYNNTLGGDGGTGLTGVLNPMYGKKHSKETRLKISESNKGKTITKQQRIKISKKLTNRVISDITKEKLKNQKIGELNPMYGKCKMVININDGSIYRNISVASEESGDMESKIRDVCNKNRNSTNRHIWYYYDDYLQLDTKGRILLFLKSITINRKSIVDTLNDIYFINILYLAKYKNKSVTATKAMIKYYDNWKYISNEEYLDRVLNFLNIRVNESGYVSVEFPTFVGIREIGKEISYN